MAVGLGNSFDNLMSINSPTIKFLYRRIFHFYRIFTILWCFNWPVELPGCRRIFSDIDDRYMMTATNSQCLLDNM